MDDSIFEIVEGLSSIEKDSTLPKSIRTKVKNTMDILQNNDKHISLRADESIEALNDICDDSNLPSYVKMQLWSIVSQLEGHR